jgi:UDP-N-acetyl-D-galactosamine dehydrogenase
MGYVGLPLSICFNKKYKVIGYDLNQTRIDQLKKNFDKTLEISYKELKKSTIYFTSNIDDIKEANIFIITVPTPIYKNNNPDLRNIINASKIVSKFLKKGDLVVYESTVYPGATDEVCIPILEKYSNLKINLHFGVGYSPERINPGDKSKKIDEIIKITSGSNAKYSFIVDSLYSSVIKVGTHRTSNIKLAEAAKVIENSQRDLNIAFINELSIIFQKIGINTKEVLEAAKTKWNFINFSPGLVGGHCIGVDPYYLTAKSKSIGYEPEIILAGRKLNDSMPRRITNYFLKELYQKFPLRKSFRVLVMGLTFKENCPDLRNSKVKEIINLLTKKKITIHSYDPYIAENFNKVKLHLKHFKSFKMIKKNNYDAIIIAVAHKEFKKIGINRIKKILKTNHIIYDLKSIFNKNLVDFQL